MSHNPVLHMVRERAGILRYAITRGTFGGSFGAFAKNLLRPPYTVLGRRKIKRVEQDGEFQLIYLEGHDAPLTYPAGYNLLHIEMVLMEQLYPWQWHNYHHAGTPIEAGDVVLDCGCAEGIFPFLHAKKVKQVVCIEPLPDFQKCLRRTFAKTPNVQIVPVAIGDAPGTAYIRSEIGNSMIVTTPTPHPVQIDTIDNLCARLNLAVTFLKADMEGFEVAALRGARETIRKHRPKIAMTTYHDPAHAEQMAAIVRECEPDYRIEFKGIVGEAGHPFMMHAWCDKR
ncbi:MAG: FkbM family methyltransferase [Verrucomicrobia bacterium]|nr:FkbM family methyltransferase [Verrucomicrobiota bacterium]